MQLINIDIFNNKHPFSEWMFIIWDNFTFNDLKVLILQFELHLD